MKKTSDLTDLILKPLDVGLKEINSLISTFEKTEDTLIAHQQSIQKIHENFIMFDLTTENPLTELISGLKSVFSFWSFGLFRLKNSLKLDILEPLKMFADNIRNMTKVFESDIGTAEETLLSCTKRLTDCKSRYLKDSETLETMETQRLGQANPAKHNLQGAVSLQLVECLNAEKKLNESHETFEKVSIKLIESVKKNEESRMYFIKTSTEKFIHHFSSFTETMAQKLKESTESISRTTCSYRVDEFYAKLNEFIPPKLAFETYNSWKHKNRSVDMVEDSLIVNSTIELLLYKKSSEQASIERLMEIVETFEGQEWFFRVLETKISSKPIGHYEITKLGEIFIRILASLPKIERSYTIFSHIIRISEMIWTNHLNLKKFLYEFLVADHGLMDERRWVYLISSEIEEKSKREAMITQRNKKRAKSKGFFESFKKINFLAKDSFEVRQEDVKRKLAREVIMTYSCKLWKFRVDQELCYSILMGFANDYNIDPECIVEMLSIIRPAREYHKHRRIMKKIENPKEFTVILPYLSLKDQVELLKVSKSLNLLLSKQVYSNILTSPKKKSLKLRKFLWIQALTPYFPAHSYQSMMLELRSNKRSIEKQRKIIKLDVNRSCRSEDIRKAVKKVLEVYAFFNKHVGYCQGMNFIVSTFYSVMKDQELTYYCLYAFIQKLKMQIVLADNLLGLKCFLYQFDKLIELKIPKVYKVFVNTESFSCNFASSWFLTAFSGCLFDRMDLLHEIWDLLFVKGWKIIFQISLIFLKIQQKNILDYYFTENTIHLSSEKIVASGIQVKNLFRIIKEVKISKKHLEKLQEDYIKIINDAKM